MAGAGEIRAGRAFVEMSLRSGELDKGLRVAQAKMRRFGSAMASIGTQITGATALVAAPLAASVKIFTSYGDSVAKMAARTGWSVEALSELQYAAGLSGADVSQLENGIRRMQSTVYDAGRGLSTANDALKDLGVSAGELQGLSPEEQFKLLAQRVSQVEDPTLRAALAMRVFGRSGTALLPLMANGAKGIEALMGEARALGLTMDAETAQAAEKLSDAIDRLKAVVQKTAFEIGASLADALTDASGKLTELAKSTMEWVKANRQIVLDVAKTTAGVGATGIALVGLGTAVKLVAGLFNPLNLALTAVAVASSRLRRK